MVIGEDKSLIILSICDFCWFSRLMKFDIMSSDFTNSIQCARRQSIVEDESDMCDRTRKCSGTKSHLNVPMIVIIDDTENIIGTSCDIDPPENTSYSAVPCIDTQHHNNGPSHATLKSMSDNQPIAELESQQESHTSSRYAELSNHRTNTEPFANTEVPKAVTTYRGKIACKLGNKLRKKKVSTCHRSRSESLNTRPIGSWSKTTDRDNHTDRPLLHNEETMKRRSYSHPDQLNLIMSESESHESRGHHANGGISNRCNSISSSRKFSTPLSDSHHVPSDSVNMDTENGSIDELSAFNPLLDDEQEDGNLWKHRPSEFKLRDQLYSFFQASDNKLAMKLFGSRNALLKEKRRQMATKTWIIHPCSNFR